MTIQEINQLSQADFKAVIGPVFEQSPWIAEAAWADRPFESRQALQAALIAAVVKAGEEALLALIKAHPDLGGRLARQGLLTKESQEEQRSAGLGALDTASLAILEERNARYLEKFGFPFVICAKLNSRATILAAMDARLAHTREQEIQNAWEEIQKIADLRLQSVIE